MNPPRMILAAAAFASVLASQYPTPGPWMVSPVNGNSYAVIPHRLTFGGIFKKNHRGDLENAAVRHGAHLATVRSAAELAWIQSTFPAVDDVYLMLGLFDAISARGREWHWASGEPVGAFLPWCTVNAYSPLDFAALAPKNHPACAHQWAAVTESPNAIPAPNGDWHYDGLIERVPPTPPVTTFGVSCPGALSTPTLRTLQGSVSAIGVPLQMEARGLTPYASGSFMIGFDAVTWNGSPLPLDLLVIGAPGCSLYIDPVLWSPRFVQANGVSPLNITPPINPNLIGLVYFVQFVGVERPTGRAAPITTTNALKVTVGWR